MTNNDARRAHELVDAIGDGRILSSLDVAFLRSFLPELPKQMTLKEILEEVESAACSVTDSYWSPSLNPQDWLWELHAQLKGLKGASATVPALPAGMRLAEHNTYGRCVVSQKVDDDGDYLAFIACDQCETKCDHQWVDPDDLTFISAKPAQPEFLETEADYEDAPEGTIVAKDDISTAWIKRFGAWKSTDGDRGVRCPNWKVGHRIILRWGWKK